MCLSAQLVEVCLFNRTEQIPHGNLLPLANIEDNLLIANYYRLRLSDKVQTIYCRLFVLVSHDG